MSGLAGTYTWAACMLPARLTPSVANQWKACAMKTASNDPSCTGRAVASACSRGTPGRQSSSQGLVWPCSCAVAFQLPDQPKSPVVRSWPPSDHAFLSLVPRPGADRARPTPLLCHIPVLLNLQTRSLSNPQYTAAEIREEGTAGLGAKAPDARAADASVAEQEAADAPPHLAQPCGAPDTCLRWAQLR